MAGVDIGRRLDAVVTELRALGVSAGLTPREVTAPGVLVGLDSIGPAVLDGPPTIVAALDLLVPDVGFPTVYTHLSTLLDRLDDLGVETVDAVVNAAGQTVGYRTLLTLDN